MRPHIVLLLLLTTPTLAADLHVNPNSPQAADTNPATPEKPLKSLQKAIDTAAGGDTILLHTANYPAASIAKSYDKPLALQAAKDQHPVLTAGLTLRKAANVNISGLTFTWLPESRPTVPMTTFLEITSSQNIDIANCEIFDDPKKDKWVGWVASISDSDHITVRDSRAHHFYFGFAATRCKNTAFKNLDIQLWSHEDGIRFTECEGPVLAEKCHITNTGIPGFRSGHVDGIQVVYWTDNLTIRNCTIHGVPQGIGAFNSGKRRRNNWLIEGNLIYDIYVPHAISAFDTDNLTIIHNTLPTHRPYFDKSTNVTLKNNIFGLPLLDKDIPPGTTIDHNLYLTGKKIVEHDLVADPQFINAPLLTLKSDPRNKDTTSSKIFFRDTLKGKLVKGDQVEILNTDGTGRDGKLRTITTLTDNSIEFDPPLTTPPGEFGVLLYKWPPNTKSLIPDYHLQPTSPAFKSADPKVPREPDMEGYPPDKSPNRGAY